MNFSDENTVGSDLIKEARTELYCCLFLDVTEQEKHHDNKDKVTRYKGGVGFLTLNIWQDNDTKLIYSLLIIHIEKYIFFYGGWRT